MSKNHEFADEDEDKKSQFDTDRDQVLDLSVKSRDNSLNKRKNRPVKSVEMEDESIEEPAELDDCESTGDQFVDAELDQGVQADLPKPKKLKTKSYTPDYQHLDTKPSLASATKKQMRFQCRFCVYKSHSVSLMQNHIYRHIDTTPYACYYCGHKSTTKSTIMVHIELCHPNMEVKIKENRVKEEDYYLDLNSSACYSAKTEAKPLKPKSHDSHDQDKGNSSLSLKSFSSISPSVSSESSLCSSPSQSPNPHKSDQLQFIKQSDEELLLNQDALEEKDSSQYSSVYNRPKQYFGSLYEPDKQYSCKLCTYTTNHKPSMEDHVYVHTNKRPYRCGYCNEEIYTRYAATYHNKYKHPGEARNFIKDEQDVSIYYVNRAKKSAAQGEEAKTAETEAAKTCKKLKLSEPRVASKCASKPTAELNARTTPPPPPQPPVANYDFGLALKMYQIQLQSLMAANYLQSIRSNQPSGNLMASYFGLSGEQLQQLSHYLSVKARMDGGDAMPNGEEDAESLLNETENSDRNESLSS
ncbi:sal 4 [Brachionus plicatilis]|uniref:Sal 4 n=1 Tax=Brachionus plicatilis TaxID=10195 RepID=A0A3M7QSM8_BRAPC|nr:sal 4 [Brachionus plicatilis]